MAGPKQMLAQFKSVWDTWSAGRKLTLVVGTLIGVGAMAVLVNVGTKPPMTTLFAGLSTEDASEVAAWLEEQKLPYEIGSDGTTILVEQERVRGLRLKLAGEGLPKGGGIGLEIFDEPAFGMSRFAEKLNYQRGLEGELRRTIRQMDAVRDARVHIVMPKRSLFKSEERPGTASVTLHMNANRQIQAEKVQAIVHLVASSVQGVEPDAVTVVDARGRILAKGGDELADLHSSLEYQRAIEKRLEERVSSILERVVGVGRVAVEVTAAVDYTQNERTLERYDPDNAAVVSEETSEEERNAGGNRVAGIPGARSNLTGTTTGAGGRTDGASSRRVQTNNYQVGKEIRHEVERPGSIARLSVAVLVDGVAGEPGADGEPTPFVPRPPAELARLGDLARSAVGFDPTRGDQIVVESIPFTKEDLEQVPEGIDWIGLAQRIVPPLLALIALLVVLNMLRKAGKAAMAARPPAMLEAPRTVRELEAAMGAPKESLEVPAIEPAESGVPKMPRPDPDKAAGVLKSWLAEN